MSQQTSGEGALCPVCGKESLDDSICGLEPFCRSCGVVVGEGTTTHIAKSLSQDESEETLTWSQYYNVRSSTEQQIAAAFTELENICDRLGLGSSVRERAAELYAEASLERATDGRPAALVIAAVIVHTTRLEGDPRPLSRIAGAADVELRSLSKIVSNLPEEVGFETRTSTPQEYVPWLCSELEVGSDRQERAISVIDELADQGLVSGKHPVGIAAAALYLAADRERTQRSIANAAGITEETVRVRVADCREGGMGK